MKPLILTLIFLGVVYLTSFSQANQTLSNLISPTTVNQHLLPNSTNTKDLGSSVKGWRHLYLTGYVYLDGSRFIANPGTGNSFFGASSGISITTGFNNTGIGFQALNKNGAGSSNTATGYQALYNNTGSYNTANGSLALNKNTAGHSNTAVGYQGLQNNTTGIGNTANGYRTLNSNIEGSYNTAIGFQALQNNTDGNFNTSTGSRSLYLNTTGHSNSVYGYQALQNNTTGWNNTAIGMQALLNNTTGFANIATGFQALNKNTTGIGNTATGNNAMYNNTIGSSNIAYGASALIGNTTGNYNTSIGISSLGKNTTTGGNTAIGYNAGSGNTFNPVNSTFLGAFSGANSGLSNVTAVGYQAIATASNQVMLGNTSVTSVKAAGSFVIYSDGRFKKDIKEEVPGLDFINQLRPVTYHYNIRGLNEHLRIGNQNKDLEKEDSEVAEQENEAINYKEMKLYTGFVAQEVEQAAKKLGYNFSGVYQPANDRDAYGLSYAEFVVPLVKAIQEISIENKQLKKELAELRQMVVEIKKGTNNSSTHLSSAYLEQSTPNPARASALIRYHVPANSASAQLVITDVKGALIKTFVLNNKGTGQLILNTAAMAAGTYNYSLWINHQIMDTKQILIIR